MYTISTSDKFGVLLNLKKAFSPTEATLTHIVNLVDRVLQQADTLHAFVIGKGKSEPVNSERVRFIQALKESSVRVHLPEGLFDELILSDKLNLIDLEDVLADSVDAVVMCVESDGSVAELGAFATNERLARKLFVVVNRDKRSEKSFINLGPLRYMRDNKWGHIHQHKWGTIPGPHVVQQIEAFARERRKQAPLPRTWQNPIRLEVLIHLLVMVYQPLAEHDVLALIDHIRASDVSPGDPRETKWIEPIARAVIQKLTNDKSIRRDLRVHPNMKRMVIGDMGLKPTRAKFPTHLSLAKDWPEILGLYFDRRVIMDVQKDLFNLRIEALHSMHRNIR